MDTSAGDQPKKTFNVLEALRESNKENAAALERIVKDAKTADEVADALHFFATHGEAKRGGILERMMETARQKRESPDETLARHAADAAEEAATEFRNYDSLLSAVTSRFKLDEVQEAWERQGLSHEVSLSSPLLQEATSYAERMTGTLGYAGAIKRMMNESRMYADIAERWGQVTGADERAAAFWSPLTDRSETMRLYYGDDYPSVIGSLDALLRDSDSLGSRLHTALDTDPFAERFRTLADDMSMTSIDAAAKRMLDPMARVSAIYERLNTEDLQDLHDEDTFEEAVQRVMSTVEDADLDSPPTEDDLSAREAFVRLVVALYPDISEDPDLHRRLRNYAAGSGVVFYLYLFAFYPGVFMVITVLLGAGTVVKVVQLAVDHGLARGKEPRETAED